MRAGVTASTRGDGRRHSVTVGSGSAPVTILFAWHDPHLWLVEIDGAEAVARVEARNAETLARSADAAFARNRETARGLLGRPERIPHAQRYGGFLSNVRTVPNSMNEPDYTAVATRYGLPGPEVSAYDWPRTEIQDSGLPFVHRGA